MTRISLKPEDVDAIVFWTRNPRPLMPYLDELDSRGYRYYFQFTILGYPTGTRSQVPSCRDRRRGVPRACRTAGSEAGRSGATTRSSSPGITRPAFHQENFQRLAESLRGHTRRVVVSIVDMYRKIEKRMKELDGTPAAICPCMPRVTSRRLMRRLAEMARENGMEIVSVAEEIGSPTVRHPSRQVR